MAIKFEDDKGGGANPVKAQGVLPVKPQAPVPASKEDTASADMQLPFAKTVRPEKKRKGR